MLLFGFLVPTLQTVEALKGNIFALSAIDASQPVHRVFLIKPFVVIDESSGRACLQRSNYSAEFLSAHIAQMTVKLAQDQLDRVQQQMAAALDISITRSVAGKVVKGLMHRAFSNGMYPPAVFNLALSRAQSSSSVKPIETSKNDNLKPRPLYLRPRSTNFTVDAIIVTDTEPGFGQTSGRLA
jgi:CheY-specific phosphatase CheX